MSSPLQSLSRLCCILYALGRYRVDQLFKPQQIPLWLRCAFKLNPFRWLPSKKYSRAKNLRLMLESLGPIFVKFGQNLSTRRDLLAEDIADELAKLQDDVPAFPGAIARKIVEGELGQPLESLFIDFDPEAFASASIAQVHGATLQSGEQVVVKILRPNISRVIDRDLSLLYTLTGLIERFWSQGPRLKPTQVVREFDYTIHDELDLRKEAANASQLRRNFENADYIYVPKIYWPYIQKNVMVMERIHGVAISDINTLRAQCVDMKYLAERGVEIFFTQVFRDCFFHADMHPGNVFVDISNPNAPVYNAIDFGIMGTLDSNDQRYLAENFLAFFNRDYRKVAELHVESGWVPAETRVDQFESAIRAVCEPIFELPLKEISFGKILLQLFQTARRFQMPVQPQLMLLQKTLFNIEGLGRQLYPDLDLWNTAKPFLEKWIKQRVGVRALLHQVRKNAPYWLEKMPDMPGLIHAGLTNCATHQPFEKTARQETVRSSRGKTCLAFGAGLLVASSILSLTMAGHIALANQPLLHNIMLGLTGAGCLSALFGLLSQK